MKSVTKCLLFCVFLFLFCACEKDENINIVHIDKEVNFISDKSDVALMEENANDVALTFRWNKVCDSLAYMLEIDKQGNNFSKSVKQNCGSDLVKSFTHSEINYLITENWSDVSYELKNAFETRLILLDLATSCALDTSNVLTVEILPYEKKNLYLIGDATLYGWQLDKAVPLNREFMKNDVFSWRGYLNVGEFKFVTTRKDFLPAYVKDVSDDTKMVFRPTEESYSDNKWSITKAGYYEVNVDLNTLSISYGIATDNIWLIGSAVNGWGWDNIIPMTSTDGHTFTYTGNLKVGELKFPIEKVTDFTGLFILANEANCAPKEDDTFVIANQPDNKWKITQAGNYSITIDLKTQKISFVKN